MNTARGLCPLLPRRTSVRHYAVACAMAVATLLAACGGGGGGAASNSSGSPPGGDTSRSPVPASAYTVGVAMSGSGTVVSVPDGIRCGTACDKIFAANTPITLNTTPASGYQFVGWSGACSGTGPCTLSMTGHRSVYAAFALPGSRLGPPVVLYTDIVSGPDTGGENGDGAYLSIFGKNFGANLSNVKVYVGGGEVARYLYLGPSNGRFDVQQLSVQLGPRVQTGAIRVDIGGASSNTNRTFTVVPGKIFYVSLAGSDTGGAIGEVGRPFRTVQGVFDRSDFGPGDFIVVRGGNYSDVGHYGSFFSVRYKGGTSGAPVTIMGYPGEIVNLVRTTQTHGIHSYSTPGHYVISNFHVDAGGTGLSIHVAPEDVRIVNNEVKNMFEDGGGSAAIGGSGKHFEILGNRVHDNGGSKLYHALYFDGSNTSGPDTIDIGYNNIYNQTGGRGVQIYGDTGTPIRNVHVHDNWIHDIALDGILFSRDVANGVQAYNNVVYRTGVVALRGPTTDTGSGGGCIRFAYSGAIVAEVYNNIFADCAVDHDPGSAAIVLGQADRLTFRNNIFYGGPYIDSDGGTRINSITGSNNLWFGGGAPPSWDASPVTADPRFLNAAAHDYHLQSGSPAINAGTSAVNTLVTSDFDGVSRPQGAGYDIGAYER